MMKDLILFTLKAVAIVLNILAVTILSVVGCAALQPVPTADIEILEGLELEVLNLANFVLTLDRPPTEAEKENIRRLVVDGVGSFRDVMERIKATEGESLAYKLLEKILLGLM